MMTSEAMAATTPISQRKTMQQKKAITPTEELAVLFPAPQPIDVAGKRIEVKPLSIRQLGRVAKAINPIVDSIDDGGEINFARLIGEHTEHAIAAIAAATGETEDWIAELPADQFIVLAKTVFEVNRSFFEGRVKPLIESLGSVITATVSTSSTAGPTS